MRTNQKGAVKASKGRKKPLSKIVGQKGVPKFWYAILLLLYIFAYILIVRISRSQEFIDFAGFHTPISSFTGVFSSLSNICLLIMVVLFGKVGLITSLVILGVQVPFLITSMILFRRPSALPGFFTSVFTVIAIITIYTTNSRVKKYQKKLQAQTLTNALTGLPSRFACTEMINSYIKNMALMKRRLSLLNLM